MLSAYYFGEVVSRLLPVLSGIRFCESRLSLYSKRRKYSAGSVAQEL